MATNSLFDHEIEEPDPKKPRVLGWSFAAVAFSLSFISICVGTAKSRSSTAAIGYIFAPFISAAIAIPGFITGWCTGYFLTWWRSPIERRRWSAVAAGLVTALAAGLIVHTLWSGNDLELQVKRIQRMNGAELETVMMDPKLNRDKFVLGAVAENPEASASMLHRIAVTDVPALHKRMGSAFAVLGKDVRGFAVMRLVAAHPNTSAEDMEILANSPDAYVRDDVAASPMLSEVTLRRLAKQGGSPEYGLARNPATPDDILSSLALRSSWIVRRGVALNPNTPADVLRGLSVDTETAVRTAVAMNADTPRDVLERLSKDSERQVRSLARRTLGQEER